MRNKIKVPSFQPKSTPYSNCSKTVSMVPSVLFTWTQPFWQKVKMIFCPIFIKTLQKSTVKPVQNGHSQTYMYQKLVFNTNYRLMQVKSIAECSKRSILQNFRPALSYHLSLRSLFCLFLSGRFTQVYCNPLIHTPLMICACKL